MPEQTKYLVIEEAAELPRMSVRAVHERTRTRSIPMRKMNATRKILFVESELHAFMDGCELAAEERADGSVIVRPLEREPVAVSDMRRMFAGQLRTLDTAA